MVAACKTRAAAAAVAAVAAVDGGGGVAVAAVAGAARAADAAGACSNACEYERTVCGCPAAAPCSAGHSSATSAVVVGGAAAAAASSAFLSPPFSSSPSLRSSSSSPPSSSSPLLSFSSSSSLTLLSLGVADLLLRRSRGSKGAHVPAASVSFVSTWSVAVSPSSALLARDTDGGADDATSCKCSSKSTPGDGGGM